MRKSWLLCGVVPLLVMVLYWPVLEFAYVWDDVALFLDSAALRGALGWWAGITQPILPGTTYFRPLVLATVYAEFQVGEPNSGFSHAINLGLFLINCGLVGLLTRRFAADAPGAGRVVAALIAMLFYALHPAQIESVAWVAGRFDLMVTLFVLLSLLCGLRGGIWGAAAMAICFGFAALSKEMAATLPALLVIMHMALLEKKGLPRVVSALSDIWGRLLILLLVGIAYLLLRSQVMANLYHQDDLVVNALNPLTHAALVGHTLIFYYKTIVAPFSNIGPLHPIDASGFDVFDLTLGVVTLTATALIGCWCVLRGGCKSLLLVAAIVGLLPVLNIVPLTIGGNVGHERFLALPLAFIATAVGVFFARLPQLKLTVGFKGLITGLVGCWLMLAAYIVFVQLPFWRSGTALWSWSYAQSPDSTFAQFSLVAELIRNGDLDSADKVLAEVEDRSDGLSLRLQILKASLMQRQGRYLEALEILDDVMSGVTAPHESVFAAGVDLSDATISRETFADGWLYRFIYGVRTESYLGLRRYGEMLDSARIGQFYQRDYPPLHFLEAMALYGLDRVDEGDEAWKVAQSLYVTQGAKEAKIILQSFKQQACRFEDKPKQFCERAN